MRGRTRAIRGLAACLALGAACGPAPEPAPLPGVLLITVDTLRADHLGAFGDPDGTSPAIDRLLRGSAAFPEAFAPRGQTWPSLTTLMTSRPPVSHGVRKNGQAVRDGCTSLADVLRARGYRTAAFLANGGKASWSGFEEVTDLRDLDLPLAARARGWLLGRDSGPFLAWIHLFSPHVPYAAPAPVTTRFDAGYAGLMDGSLAQIRDLEAGRATATARDVRHVVARYDGEVSWVDGRVADLLDTLEEAGLARRTLVVFAADHGEELHARNGYFSHSASIFDTVLRVPCAFRLPGAVPGGIRDGGVIDLQDVAPTVLGLLGVPAPDEWEGRDLAAVVRGTASLPAGHVARAELEDRVVSARTARWRYVHNPDGFDYPLPEGGVFPLPRVALYDHATDPGERTDVAEAHPAVADSLRRDLEAWMTAHGWAEASLRHERAAIPSGMQRELEALGYVN